MVTPFVHVLFHRGALVLPHDTGSYPPARLASTPGDNLAEYAGRLCYASLCKPRSRPTPEYHAHIHATGHNSVYAHAVETFEVEYHEAEQLPDSLPLPLWDVGDALHCRPGVWVTHIDATAVRFAASPRAVLEWAQHGPEYADSLDDHNYGPEGVAAWLGGALAALLRPDYPLTVGPGPDAPEMFRRLTVRRVPPERPKERWCSLYIAGVSRDLLQELVRHHWQTNPSVESTRYVDKSTDAAVLHPALTPGTPLADYVDVTQAVARAAYSHVFNTLRAGGVPEKTARGAARACLPGATTTRLVFSLSQFQARHILALRGDQTTGSVDPEIGRLAGLMRAALLAIWPDL